MEKDYTLNIKLTKEMANGLKEKAKKYGISIASVVRIAIATYLEKEKEKK